MKNLAVNTIMFAQAQINYTDLCCADGKKHTISKTLKKVEQDLLVTGQFLRINKGFLINISFVKSFLLDESKVYMNNDMVFSISRRRLKALRTTLKNQITSNLYDL